MNSALFRVPPLRRGRMALMVLGSLVFHGALVGLGAVFWQPIDKPIEVPVTEVAIEPLGDPEVRELVVPFDAPTPPPDQPTPPPDMTPPPDDTPPPEEAPDMDEPDKPTPPPKPKTTVKYAATPAPAGAKRGPVAVTGVVGGNPNGTKATGVPGSPNGKAGGTWSTPKPPYPAAARASHITGTTTISITTDASGRVSNVDITKSAGSPILDFYTKSYVKNNWKGPPSTTHSTTFEYKLQ